MQQELKSYHLRLDDAAMSVLLDCEVHKDDIEDLSHSIRQDLEELNVADAPSVQAIQEWLTEATQANANLQNAVLMEGTPPVPPQDGQIEWAADFFNEGFEKDPVTGAIDYRRPAGVKFVAEEQLLARLIPATEGKEGKNVLGQPIPPRKPKRLRIRVGSNVRVDKAGGAFYATAGGRIRWVNGLLSVDQEYVVRGSVGLETGHIVHPGALTVDEDILEDSEVKTVGDIEVKGVVEAASIETQGNLTVYRGITRCEDRVIKVAGKINAKFILGSKVHSDGDITVEREIVNSEIVTGGKITMPKGRLVGGTIQAFGGIKAGQAGSVGNVLTRISVGHADKIRARYEERLKVEEELEKARLKCEAYVNGLGNKKEEDLLPEEQAILDKHQLIMTEKEEAFKRLQQEIEGLRKDEEKDGKRPSIYVRAVLFPGTTLCIDRARLQVQEEVRGPLTAVYADGEIVLEK